MCPKLWSVIVTRCSSVATADRPPCNLSVSGKRRNLCTEREGRWPPQCNQESTISSGERHLCLLRKRPLITILGRKRDPFVLRRRSSGSLLSLLSSQVSKSLAVANVVPDQSRSARVAGREERRESRMDERNSGEGISRAPPRPSPLALRPRQGGAHF